MGAETKLGQRTKEVKRLAEDSETLKRDVSIKLETELQDLNRRKSQMDLDMKEKEKEIRSRHRTEFELKDQKMKAEIDIARKKVEEDRILNEKKVRQMEEDMKSALEAEKKE